MIPIGEWWWLPRLARMGVALMGRVTGQPGMGQVLPHFLVIGAMKAGSTAFFGALTGHPRIREPLRKEIHFFDTRFDRGLAWYRQRFPTRLELRGGAITGEGSPSYMFDPHAARRIHAVLPQARFIAVLRDPVDRAISHYFHERRRGREPLAVDEAMAAEDERLEPELRRMQDDENYTSAVFRRFGYKRRGLYAEQLARFLELFPREQLLIVKSEEFWARPRDVLRQAYLFLGLDPDLGPAEPPRRNRGKYAASDVPESTREALARYFAPHNERLYQLVGSDWGWKRPV